VLPCIHVCILLHTYFMSLFCSKAVENAFSFSRNVMTVSFHKYEAGFYPGECKVGTYPSYINTLYQIIHTFVKPHVQCIHTHMHTVTSSSTLTGTGSVDKVGEGRGSFFSVNVPLNDGIRDKPFTELFAR